MKPQKIKSPKTNRYIYINGDAYNKLIKNDGYTEEYLQSLPKLTSNTNVNTNKQNTSVNNIFLPTSQKISVNNIFLPDDVLKEILYTSDINTIINYCSTKKYHSVCNDKNLWKSIFIRDGIKMLEEPDDYKGWIEMYKNTVNAYKEAYALLTIPRSIGCGSTEFEIDNRFNKYFNKYVDFLSKINTFYTNLGQKRITLRPKLSYYGDINIISIKDFYNLMVDILYFYPNVKIKCLGYKQIPLRKKYIGELRYNADYKTDTSKILHRYQIVSVMSVSQIINEVNKL